MTNESSDYNNYCLEDLFINTPRTTYPSAHFASINEVLLNNEDEQDLWDPCYRDTFVEEVDDCPWNWYVTSWVQNICDGYPSIDWTTATWNLFFDYNENAVPNFLSWELEWY